MYLKVKIESILHAGQYQSRKKTQEISEIRIKAE